MIDEGNSCIDLERTPKGRILTNKRAVRSLSQFLLRDLFQRFKLELGVIPINQSLSDGIPSQPPFNEAST